MPRRRGRARGRHFQPRSRGLLEWIGGRISPPIYLRDRDEPYRPELVLWLDSTGIVVGQEVVVPEDAEGVVARLLLHAMEQPFSGTRRRPDQIRVASQALAAEVRTAVGDGIPVAVAPTPELDAVVGSLMETMPSSGGESSYFDGGRIPPGLVRELFVSAERLYRCAPWKSAYDSQVLKLDIPSLGVEGACVSVMGNLGQSFGLIIFPSLAGYQAFYRLASAGSIRKKGRVDLGTDWLSLNFERGGDLPADTRREALAHGWPVAGPDAYPLLLHVERDGGSRPLVQRDYQIATLAASAVHQFFGKHRARFEEFDVREVSESYDIPTMGLEVHLTLPYPNSAAFLLEDEPGHDAGEASPHGRKEPGRNEPCPCGSGRKYKKCCMNREFAGSSAAERIPSVHELDYALIQDISRFAEENFGSAWKDFEKDFNDAAAEPGLAPHWSTCHFRVRGATALAGYLDRSRKESPPLIIEWLEAQAAAWLSVWEVTAVEPGSRLTLRDLLSDEQRIVWEKSGSETLVVRDVLLARVVDFKGDTLLCGTHSRPLPPLDAAEVVRRVRGRLRRKTAVPVERLRDEGVGRYLIRQWEDAVDALDERSGILPDFRNTDDDPLLITIDHFDISSGAVKEVTASLAGIDDAQSSIVDDDPVYEFVRPGPASQVIQENTVMGRALVSGTTLRLETNSRNRADMLRLKVEAACGDRIRHRAREYADPRSERVRSELPEVPPEEFPPEVEQQLLEFKRRHYAEWIDLPVPALNGETPREAVRSADGRAAVDALLKSAENTENRSARGATFDFSGIRRELGLPE